ncbi:carbohydrate ABC transporter permease [Microbacterium sp. ARD31]|uniref:carbohydrate ABC transporter permease n=1 Tax=Microbacterium sp. ARD31 TaxID=2962576 RepID=UPI0037CA8920
MTTLSSSAQNTTTRAILTGTDRRHRSPRKKSSVFLFIVMVGLLAYFLLPVFWLVVASTKTTGDLFTTFGLWFGQASALFENIAATLTYENGVYVRWLLNTVVYSGVSAVGATLLCAMGGYGFSKFKFGFSRVMFAVVVGAIMVPTTALAIPTYLLFSRVGIVDTPLAVIIPSLVSPFGLYLMRVYADDAVPDSLIEAARIDGAGETRIFFTIALRLLAPGLVTVFLFTLVGTWNNYFLPLIMINSSELYPITVGLAAWSSQTTGGGGGSSGSMISLVITGSFLCIIPLIAVFLMLQRYWQSGLAAGSVKQ